MPDEPAPPAAATDKTGKSQALAVVLAILVGHFSWLYTWKFDAWKFWAALAISAGLALAAGFIWSTIFAEAVVIWVGSGLLTLLAIIDQARKPTSYWENYRLRPKTKLTAKLLAGRLVLVAAVAAPLIAWQLTIRSQPADFDVEVLSFECGLQAVENFLPGQGSQIERGHFCRLEFKLTNPTAELQTHLGSQSPPYVSSLLSKEHGHFAVIHPRTVEYHATTICDSDRHTCCSLENLPRATADGCHTYFVVPPYSRLGQIRLKLENIEGSHIDGDLTVLDFRSSRLDLD